MSCRVLLRDSWVHLQNSASPHMAAELSSFVCHELCYFYRVCKAVALTLTHSSSAVTGWPQTLDAVYPILMVAQLAPGATKAVHAQGSQRMRLKPNSSRGIASMSVLSTSRMYWAGALRHQSVIRQTHVRLSGLYCIMWTSGSGLSGNLPVCSSSLSVSCPRSQSKVARRSLPGHLADQRPPSFTHKTVRRRCLWFRSFTSTDGASCGVCIRN